MGLMFGWQPFRPADVAVLKELIAASVIEPRIDSRFSLDEVALALKRVDDGLNRGKVVVLPEARTD
jgi:hypothetical protein